MTQDHTVVHVRTLYREEANTALGPWVTQDDHDTGSHSGTCEREEANTVVHGCRANTR